MPAPIPPLFVRADASPDIGVGHVMRCLALAQYWADRGGKIHFVGDYPAGLRSVLVDEGFSVHAAGNLETLPVGATVVLDGYRFEADYQRQLASGRRLVVFDDTAHLPEYHADLLVNTNPGAEELNYVGKIGESRLGTDYVLLRREFREFDFDTSRTGRARNLLVTMGGSDPLGLTPRIVEALRQVEWDGLEIRVVLGPAHENEIAPAPDDARIEVIRNVKDMPKLLAWADLAISAAGSTAWELAFMGLPALLVTVAPNQKAIVHALASRGAALHLGPADEIDWAALTETVAALLRDSDRLSKMALAGRSTIDGEGVVRLFDVLVD